MVIDAHIIDHEANIMTERETKIMKYPDNAAIRFNSGAVEVRFYPLVISRRRIWCHKSVKDLFGISLSMEVLL